MKKSMRYRALGLLMCLCLILCGCGEEPEGLQSSPAQQAEREPVTILTGRQNYGAFVDLLNERYPEVRLELISYYGGDTSSYMEKSLQEGDIPDIYTVTYVPDGGEQKAVLLNLSNYSVVNEYASTTIDGLSVDGGIYLLPARYSLLGMVYNKTLMEENGWQVPNSFQELKALAPKIQSAGYKVVDLKSSLTGTTFGSFFALGSTNYFGTPQGSQWKLDYLRGNSQAADSLTQVTDYFQQWIDQGFVTSYYYDHPELPADTEFDQRKYVFQLYSNRLTSQNSQDEYGFMPFLSEDGSNNMLVRLVSRYYGLNKELGEEGNEEKLEDALKVLQLMATQEGQEALSGGDNIYIPSSSINQLPQGSPYEGVLDLINRGNMVDMVYSGWETIIVPLIENYANPWINGEATAKDFRAGMDVLRDELLEGTETEVLATAPQELEIQDAARLCAIGQGIAAGAEVSFISLPGFHGFSDGVNLENKNGVFCKIYQGDITTVDLGIFAPGKGSLVTLTMTGKEINDLAAKGLLAEGDPTPFEFCMVTREGVTLEDEGEYTVAINSLELTEPELASRAEETEISPIDAIGAYLKSLGTVTPEALVWQ